jgi:acyl-CoA synthetase (AMP-forming)/AMP-acid ligase II
VDEWQNIKCSFEFFTTLMKFNFIYGTEIVHLVIFKGVDNLKPIEALNRARKYYSKKEAVVCGETRLTYEQVYIRSKKLAYELINRGMKKGDRIAVLEKNCHRYLEIYFATAIGGFVIVPLNYRLSSQELVKVLKDSGCIHIVLNPLFYEKVGNYIENHKINVVLTQKTDNHTSGINYEDLLDAIHDNEVDQFEMDDIRKDDDVFELFYTSGSTGEPKGVMLTHHNVAINALMVIIGYQFTEDDVWIHSAPQFHLADAWANWAITWLGGTHVFQEQFESTEFLALVEKEKGTCTNLVPTMLNSVLENEKLKDFDVSSLRFIMSGAAPLPITMLQKVLKLGCGFYHGYGMTEASPMVTLLQPIDIEKALKTNNLGRLKSAGRPLPGAELKIVNDQGEEVPVGERGEIIIKGPLIMKGYWGNPKATEKAVKDHWFYSGDIGFLDEDGFLYVVDRKKDMIITGGENVYSTEVEQVLYELPNVFEASVIGLPDEHWGEIVTALISLKDNTHINTEEIKAFCRKKIAGYKVPKKIVFVDEIPKTGSGKISKIHLREMVKEMNVMNSIGGK